MELRRRAIKRWVPCGDMDRRLKIPHSAKVECGFRTTPEECLYDSGLIGHQYRASEYNTIQYIPSKPKHPVIRETEAGTFMVSPFSKDEYRKGVATLKNNKAADRDDVLVEQLKNLGPNAHKWLRAMLNNCFIDNKIPTI